MSITYKNWVPPFPPERLEAISKVLPYTDKGLTGTEYPFTCCKTVGFRTRCRT